MLRICQRIAIWTIVAFALVPLLALGTVGGCAWIVRREAARRVCDDLAQLRKNDVALVLGTSKSTRGGFRNLHFYGRMDAAARLYQAGRVRHFIVSGDNGTRGYDEPADMEAALIERGVPLDAITRDDAGFRTLDSIVRAAKVFGQSRLTIVTDRFHAYRAVFLARHFGIDAVAFPSREVELRYSAKSRAREWLADVKACLDLYVLHTAPRFLGPRIPVRIAAR